MENELNIGLEQARTAAVDLDKELLVLRLALGKLKAAIADAGAPLMGVLAEGLQKVVFWAIRMVKVAGQVAASLFGVSNAGKITQKAVTAAAKAAKKSLADFDELNRLQNNSEEVITPEAAVPAIHGILPQAQAIADSIRALLAPLQEIDLFPLRWSFARLSESAQAVSQQVVQALNVMWHQALVPFAAWLTEKLVPALVMDLRAALDAVSAVLTPLGAGFAGLWQAIQPGIDFVGTTALSALEQLRQLFIKLTATMTEKAGTIQGIFENIGQIFTVIWSVAEPVLTALLQLWTKTFSQLTTVTSDLVGHIIDGFYSITEYLAGVFTGNWSRAWQGLKGIFKASINGILGLMNALLAGVSGAINAVVQAANKLSFTLPDWVPGLGSQTFGLNLPTIATPQIPYLAKGAVLPANRPFLAVVGDQRHGTNIEAPLTTIQEAVANVMADMLPAMVAGFEATVDIQRDILQAVLGISIGDEVLSNAVSRYQRKMAIVEGV
ncbi:MAG: hypothetical protein IKC95_04645 [Oscillospiraceae bacterium]|nr:hypothetical protein [Oscillospiraceae bacterium]